MKDNGCFKKEKISILDVGSGNGTFSWYLDKFAERIISLDYSENLLKSNPAKLKILADGCKLPFKDNQFDCSSALSSGCLEGYDLNDYSQAIGICKPILKHPSMTKDEIQELFKYAYTKFYQKKRQVCLV